MDGAQLRIYDGLCNRESTEYPADSRRLRICTRLDPALGYPVADRNRALMAQRFHEAEVGGWPIFAGTVLTEAAAALLLLQSWVPRTPPHGSEFSTITM